MDSDRRAVRRVLVIGAGASGLTTALCLRRAGIEAALVAEQFPPQVTSSVAGALWEWPPAVCRQAEDQDALARSKEWCKVSYETFADLARDPRTGVYLRPGTFYLRRPVEDDPGHFRKMIELKDHVREFIHDPALIDRNRVNPASGVRDAYTHLTPMIDTDAYLQWLEEELRGMGTPFLQERLNGDIRTLQPALMERFQVDAIVNCAGLGARELAQDAMFPVRGALIRVRNDGVRLPRIAQAHCVAPDHESESAGFIFIVPRGRDRLLLGGIAEPDRWELDIGLHNHEPVRRMFQRCIDFLPELAGAEVDAAEPVRVGLRPFRLGGARVGREPGTRIFHNYGHGGAGVTLSWGCAREVVEAIAKI